VSCHQTITGVLCMSAAAPHVAALLVLCALPTHKGHTICLGGSRPACVCGEHAVISERIHSRLAWPRPERGPERRECEGVFFAGFLTGSSIRRTYSRHI
jgi:hypothetical protein